MSDKVILVIGGTGKQGGAVLRHLLSDGWKVRALVRDPDKESAHSLKQQGAEIVKGDLFDRPSIERALEGAYGVFGVQNFWLPEVGFEGEVKQGTLLADAAKEASVSHLVYSSVGAAHRGMGQKHFESKWIIEQHIQKIGLPHTIVRPVAFMDNVEWTKPAISNGRFQSWGIHPEKRTQLIAVEDIGAIVAIVFTNHQEYLSKTLEIAGDELTELEQVETLTRVIGRPVELAQPQMQEGASPNEEQLASFNFFNGEAYTADIEAVRKLHPGLRSYEQYLRDWGWENLPVLPMPENTNPWGG